MANFPFLGHPSQPQIGQLTEYLNTRYNLIQMQIEAVQSELDNLLKVSVELKRAEATIASEDQYNKNASLENYIRAPTINEDFSYFESFKYDSTETANTVDSLLKPWQSHMRGRERLLYKIKKITYLMEQKGLQIQILQDLQADLRDDGNPGNT